MKHRQQLQHHAATFKCRKALYTVASEQAIIYTVLVEFDEAGSNAYVTTVNAVFEKFSNWAENGIPSDADMIWGYATDRDTVQQALQLRNALRRLVTQINNPLPSAK